MDERRGTVVVGIDEAGYGPLLGPLVVTAVAIEVPAARVSEPLWDLLGDAVARAPDRTGRRVAIADSKRLFRGGSDRAGMARLERGVLAALTAAGACPADLAGLVAALAPDTFAPDGPAPWYKLADRPLPVAAGGAEIASAGARLAEAAARAGVRIAAVHSEVVLEPRFNLRIGALDNKAAVLSEAVMAVLARALGTGPGRRAAVIDRQGGRAHYRATLERGFPGGFVWVGEERREVSAYRLVTAEWEADVRFEVGADAAHLPVALASMVSKYLRELFMDRLNRYWCDAVPGLAPTSGYWVDGGRFLAEIDAAREARGVPLETVRRSR